MAAGLSLSLWRETRSGRKGEREQAGGQGFPMLLGAM